MLLQDVRDAHQDWNEQKQGIKYTIVDDKITLQDLPTSEETKTGQWDIRSMAPPEVRYVYIAFMVTHVWLTSSDCQSGH